MNLNLLEKLNDKQREAASQIDGSILILAGAGSGKTRTITYRIAHMVENVGISPYSILAVTFTNKNKVFVTTLKIIYLKILLLIEIKFSYL